MSVAFIDLDRTLLRRASGPALNRALISEGILGERRDVPGESLIYGIFDRLGENAASMGLARAAAKVAKGWDQAATVAAGKVAVAELLEIMAPFAPQRLAAFREQGLRLVLATTSPNDLVKGIAEALGFDDVIATRYEVEDGRYTGRIDGRFVWGLGKLRAVQAWAHREGVDLADCHACSDSFFDVPLLSSVGHPHAVNADPRLRIVAAARRWPAENWDRPDGVPSLLGIEPFALARLLVRPEMFPYARFDIQGLDNIPSTGPVIVASNHRSYFDVAALGIVAASTGRPVRALAKKELFDIPGLGVVTRAFGGIAVDRSEHPEKAFGEALSCLEAGEVLFVLPQGTIPRGPEFFEPVLRGKTGTARLAALTDAPVVPVGVWGTEAVWARSSKVPNTTNVLHPPTVTIRIGEPMHLPHEDARVDTDAIMEAISALLPLEANERRTPTAEELARTYPSGKAPTESEG
jgi:putative phosphoserine phosphatase/1-acylglycerol-3-phosphate O-acyltransferase